MTMEPGSQEIETTTIWDSDLKRTQNDIKDRLERMRKRTQEGDSRIDKSASKFNEEMDRIKVVSDRGIDIVLKSFEKNSILGYTDEVIGSRLINMTDLDGLELKYSADKLESVLTAYTINLMGLDESNSINNTEKEKIAKMIWGREVIVTKLQEKGEKEGIKVSRDEARNNLNFVIFFMCEDLPVGPAELREKVNDIALAFGDEEGRKQMIKMAIDWKEKKFFTN